MHYTIIRNSTYPASDSQFKRVCVGEGIYKTMSNSSIIENIHNLLEEEHSSRIKRMHFRAITFLLLR